MREMDPQREYADATALTLAMGDIMTAVQAGHAVPLTRDGEVVAVVVSPEVAEAGRRALDR